MRKNPLFTLISELIILSIIVLTFLGIIIPEYEQSYPAALIDKVTRLESIDQPKIVLIGNSNLAFGIDSAKIEEEFGMPVVNMGLHGGLGNAMHEEMAKMNVCEGDIYIICHTNYSDSNSIEDGVLAWTTIEDHWDLWRLLRNEDIKTMIDSFPIYLKKCITLWLDGSGNQIPPAEYYYRGVFNEYGDVAKSRKECRLDEDAIASIGECPGINDNCIDRLNKLNNYLNERGAEMVVAAYPVILPENSDEEFNTKFRNFEQELAARLECPVISEFTDYFYDQSYFFDTIHHLNDNGVKLRTQQLIDDLTVYMEKVQ